MVMVILVELEKMPISCGSIAFRATRIFGKTQRRAVRNSSQLVKLLFTFDTNSVMRQLQVELRVVHRWRQIRGVVDSDLDRADEMYTASGSNCEFAQQHWQFNKGAPLSTT